MSAACSRRPIRILGIGNILLRDEGVGVHVIDWAFERLIWAIG